MASLTTPNQPPMHSNSTSEEKEDPQQGKITTTSLSKAATAMKPPVESTTVSEGGLKSKDGSSSTSFAGGTKEPSPSASDRLSLDHNQLETLPVDLTRWIDEDPGTFTAPPAQNLIAFAILGNEIPPAVALKIAKKLGDFTDPLAQKIVASAIRAGKLGAPIPQDVAKEIAEMLGAFTAPPAQNLIAFAIRDRKLGDPIPPDVAEKIYEKLGAFTDPEAQKMVTWAIKEYILMRFCNQEMNYFGPENHVINSLLCELKNHCDQAEEADKESYKAELEEFYKEIISTMTEALKTCLKKLCLLPVSEKDFFADNFFILIPFKSEESKENYNYAVIDQDTLGKMLGANPKAAIFSRVYRINPSMTVILGKELSTDYLDTLYEQVPYLREKYFEAKNNTQIDKIIELFDYSDFLEFENNLETAFAVNRFEGDLLDTESQGKLDLIFEKLFEREESDPYLLPQNKKISEAHLDMILETFDYKGKTGTEKANLLLVIATIFIKLSSASMFGNEAGSPTSIPRYGAALLNSAKEVWPSVSVNVLIDEWIAEIFNVNETTLYYGCMNNLAGQMKTKLESVDSELMGRLYPPIW